MIMSRAPEGIPRPVKGEMSGAMRDYIQQVKERLATEPSKGLMGFNPAAQKIKGKESLSGWIVSMLEHISKDVREA